MRYMFSYCSYGQLCLTLCDPMDCSLPGSCPQNFTDQNTRISPGGLPNPGTEPKSPEDLALAVQFFTIMPPDFCLNKNMFLLSLHILFYLHKKSFCHICT